MKNNFTIDIMYTNFIVIIIIINPIRPYSTSFYKKFGVKKKVTKYKIIGFRITEILVLIDQ